MTDTFDHQVWCVHDSGGGHSISEHLGFQAAEQAAIAYLEHAPHCYHGEHRCEAVQIETGTPEEDGFLVPGDIVVSWTNPYHIYSRTPGVKQPRFRQLLWEIGRRDLSKEERRLLRRCSTVEHLEAAFTEPKPSTPIENIKTIKKSDIVAGYSAKMARDFLRKFRLGWYRTADDANLNSLSDYMRMTLTDCKNYRDRLISEGYIEIKDNEYIVAKKGMVLANMRFIRRLPRSDAEKLLAQVIARVADINTNNDYVIKVNSMALFGSMLTTAETVGDIDLVVDLKLKEGHHGTLDGHTRVKQALRGRSPYVSLHDRYEVDQMGCDYKMIFEDEASEGKPTMA